MIQSISKNINFGKSLLASPQVRVKGDDPHHVRFVQYDFKTIEDRGEIADLRRDWGKNALFIDAIADSFILCSKSDQMKKSPDAPKFYGLENDYGETLAVAKVLPHGVQIRTDKESYDNCMSINYVQSAPQVMHQLISRKYKGAGEVLTSKIVEEARKEGVSAIVLESQNEHFWSSSGLFKKLENASYNRILTKDDFEGYINFVEKKLKEKQ